MKESIEDNSALAKEISLSGCLFLVDEINFQFGEWKETGFLRDKNVFRRGIEFEFDRRIEENEIYALIEGKSNVFSSDGRFGSVCNQKGCE